MQNDPMDITLGRMGEISSARTDSEIERLQEYAAFAMRGFGSSKTKLRPWRYGSVLEAAMARQSVTHRGILSIRGIKEPLTYRTAIAFPALDWGIGYGSTPHGGTVTLRDFTPWNATKLGDFV